MIPRLGGEGREGGICKRSLLQGLSHFCKSSAVTNCSHTYTVTVPSKKFSTPRQNMTKEILPVPVGSITFSSASTNYGGRKERSVSQNRQPVGLGVHFRSKFLCKLLDQLKLTGKKSEPFLGLVGLVNQSMQPLTS